MSIYKNGIWTQNSFIERALPEDYVQVEYIQNSGTQYIDTGFIYDKAKPFKIEIKYQPTNTTSRGCLLSNYASTYHLSYELNNSGKERLYINNGAIDKAVTAYTTDINESSVEYNNGVIIFDTNGTITTYTYQMVNSTTTSLYMFVDQAKRFSTFTNYIKVYECKIYENNKLIRNFIPCYRISDNAIGMYDIVNGIFYNNAGTGTFNKGNNIGGTSANVKIYKDDNNLEANSFIEI